MKTRSKIIGIGAVTGLIGLGSLVYSEMPDVTIKVTLDDGLNVKVHRYERANITDVEIGYKRWIMDVNHDFHADFKRTRSCNDRYCTDYDEPVNTQEIDLFNKAVTKAGLNR